MTDSTPTRPLWRLMQDAYFWGDCVTKGKGPNHGIAAELRAVADWLVPEDFGDPFDDNETMHETQARMYIRSQLLKEANRAEAGE